MSEERPLWRQGFDAVERAVGPSLAAFAKSEPFAVAVGLALRAQREAQARTERNTRRLLHLMNLPAGSDVTRILAELGRLQAQVRELTKQVGDTQKGGSDGRSSGNGGAPRPRQTRR